MAVGTLAADATPRVPGSAFAPAPVPGLFELPPVPPAAGGTPGPSVDSGVHFVLRQLRFDGNTVLGDAELQSLVADALGQTVGPAEIEAIRLKLTRRYVDAGYVNSGLVLRRADAEQGRLDFDVVEGRLTALTLQGLQGLQPSYISGRLQRDGDGPFNLDSLRERFQLLLGDPLFDRLNARLLPGEAPGEARLEVDVTRARPYGVTLFANNHRPVSVGAATLGASGWLRNLTGHGDLVEASVLAPVDRGSDLRGSIGWRVPLGAGGTQLSLQLDQGDSSVLEQSVRSLDIRSRLGSQQLGLDQVVVESLAHKFSLGLQAVHRVNRSWLLGSPFSFNPGEPDGVVREHLWRFWQEWVQRSETQVLALRSSVIWGRNNLQAIEGLPGSGLPPARYRIWQGQAQFARQLSTHGVQLRLRALVQRSPDRLLALDGLAVGGVDTVRGYRENQLVRDQGYSASIELEWPLVRGDGQGLTAVAVPFYDQGRAGNHGQAGTTLRAAGVALRLGWRRMLIELVVARRIDPPAELQSLGNNLQDQGIHLQVSWRH